MPTDDDRAFAAALRSRRKEKQLSQAELGQYVGLSAATINRYEKSHRGPTAQDLARLEDVLGALGRNGRGLATTAVESDSKYGADSQAGKPSTEAIAAGAIIDGLPSEVHRLTALRMLTRYSDSVASARPQPPPPPSYAPSSAQPGEHGTYRVAEPTTGLNVRSHRPKAGRS